MLTNFGMVGHLILNPFDLSHWCYGEIFLPWIGTHATNYFVFVITVQCGYDAVDFLQNSLKIHPQLTH